jgi:hypothetical protein
MLGVDGHDFIYDRPNECDFLREFDWILCNNTIVKNKEIPKTICIKTDFLPKYTELLENLAVGGNFALVSCASNFSPIYRFPDETRRILENPYLQAWYSENNTGVITARSDGGTAARVLCNELGAACSQKMHCIPAGLNYHNRAKKKATQLAIAEILAADGGFASVVEKKKAAAGIQGAATIAYILPGAVGAPPEYYKSFCGIMRNLMSDFSAWIECGACGACGSAAPTPIDSIRELSKFSFLLCPGEYTIDSAPHVWEALALGVVPIMMRNPFLEEMYAGMPIYFVDSWNECISPSPQFYKATYERLWGACGCAAPPQQLYADYWLSKIKQTIHMPPLFVPPERIDTKLVIENMDDFWNGAEPRAEHIFSFCIYGKNKMYYLGLRENIIQIRKYFSRIGGSGGAAAAEPYKIYIFVGTSADEDLLCSEVLSAGRVAASAAQPPHDIKLYKTGHDGVINMIYRYAPAAAVPCNVFARDADSVIAERDISCIFDFMRTSAEVGAAAHVIRDHFHHKSKITGGLSGITPIGCAAVADVLREKIRNFEAGQHSVYGADEVFLNNTLYDLLRAAGTIVVHSNMCEYPGEIRRPILCRNTLTNFCGNVLQREPFAHFQFLYNDMDVHEHYKWCRGAGAPPELFINSIISLNPWRDFTRADFCCGGGGGGSPIMDDLLYGGMMQLPYSARSKTVVYLIECFLDLGVHEKAMECYKLFAYCEVDEVAKTALFARFLRESNKKIVCMTSGCCEAAQPRDEIWIVYGNYPDDWRAYPAAHTIYRNVCFYESDRASILGEHEWRESPGWSNIDCIYLMGIETAPERIHQSTIELANAGASLEKLVVYRAAKDDTKEAAYLGATKNHMECLAVAAAAEQTALFLEDDFVFSEPAAAAAQKLGDFFAAVDMNKYDVCFLAASKMHERAKWLGGAAAADVIETRQYCTTSSAYIVPRTSIARVFEIVKEGYENLVKTGDSATYCIDRFWTKIQRTRRMIMFKEKLGFQRPSVSKITGELNTMLD